MTLLILAIAAASAAATCLAGLRRASATSAAAGELQRRWGMISLQAALLPRAQVVLAEEEKIRREPTVSARASLQLGGLEFTAVVADEQAKASVNSLYERSGREDARRAINTLLMQCPGTLSARLLPAVMPTAAASEPKRPMATRADGRVFQSFGQILPKTSPKTLLGTGEFLTPAALMTCWGDGKLNVRRTTRETLTAMTTPALNGANIDELLRLRMQKPDADLFSLLSGLQLTAERRAQAQGVLTDVSTCHSLWLVCSDGRRSWYRLAVQDGQISRPTSVMEW